MYKVVTVVSQGVVSAIVAARDTITGDEPVSMCLLAMLLLPSAFAPQPPQSGNQGKPGWHSESDKH